MRVSTVTTEPITQISPVTPAIPISFFLPFRKLIENRRNAPIRIRDRASRLLKKKEEKKVYIYTMFYMVYFSFSTLYFRRLKNVQRVDIKIVP